MTITYWTVFAKRINSTAQPAISGTDADVKLKEGTSIENPVFLLSGDLFDINYIKAFTDHYYFVTDIKSVRNGLIEVACQMDVLATFKTEIENYTCLIERSDSFYDNSYPDPAVSMKNKIFCDDTAADPSLYDSDGYFVISVLNNVGSGTGFTSNYLITKTMLQTLASYVNTDWGSMAQDILSWLQSTFLKTASSIIDCIWLPIASSALNNLPITWETMKIGVDNVVTGGGPVTGGRMTGVCIATSSCSATIPHHYTTAGDFRRASPYTVGKIFIPGYGYAEFNPLDFEPSGNINITTVIDISTGDIAVYLSNDDSVLVASYNFNIGVSCPVGKVGANVTETIGGVLSTASNIALFNQASNPVSRSIADYAAASSMVNTLSSAAGVTASYSGRKSGRAAWKDNKRYAIAIFAKDTQDPASMESTSGRPDMTERQISSCNGYVKCINASVPIAGFGNEKEIVNSYLNNGFYHE